MSDIVERLLALAREYHQHRPHYEEAAAEIERLTRERDEWKEKWMALAQAALTVSALEQKP